MGHSRSTIEQVEILLKASYKLIFFCTQEEVRAEAALKQLATGREGFSPREYFCWTETDGFIAKDHTNVDGARKTADPVTALEWVIERERREVGPGLYVMKDLHPFINPRTGRSTVVRKIKDAVRALEPTRSAITILCGPQFEIPSELEKDSVIVDYELPTFAELKAKLTEFAAAYTGRRNIVIDLTEDDIEALAKAAQGLTMAEAELAFAKALVVDNRLDRSDVAQIVDEKKQIIRKTGILTFEEPDGMENVGGLENLKSWLSKRRDILTERARRYNIPAPKGVMLTGVPGCGKSLCAKAMAQFWNIPLLRLDMGAVFSGLVGSSEANIRKAIRCAEAMAPCVMMIDEIEKGLAGSSSGGGDSGTSTRVFGTLLTWMSDKTCPVFVVATANEFDRLPPEMLRKGRFDEIFFVDFPHNEERRIILQIHIRKRGRDPERYDLPRLVEATRDFTGSEIEQAIVTGMIEAFSEDGREFGTEDILSGISKTIPLIDTMQDKIAGIRLRAMQCTVSASKAPDGEASHNAYRDTSSSTAGAPGPPDEPSPIRGGRQLDL